MWEQIGTAAIYGAIGGGGGALLGSLLAIPFKNTKFAQTATTLLTVSLAVAGIRLAEPLLSPYIGEYLPASSVESVFDREFDSVIESLEDVPIMAAILEREPDLTEQMKAELLAVIDENASTQAMSNALYTASYQFTQSRLIHYIQRATDDDLIIFMQTNVELLADLLLRDPQFCYDLNYNPNALSALGELDAIRDKTGPEFFDRQQKEGAVLVRNAHDEIPPYDTNIGAAGLQSAAEALIGELGQENLPIITGERIAASVDEAALACRATKVMFDTVLSLDEPATVGRHIFISTS